MQRSSEYGPKAAKAFGAEYQANPGSSRKEYLDSSAYYFGNDKEKFSDLSPEEKTICLKEFNAGVAQEKALQ